MATGDLGFQDTHRLAKRSCCFDPVRNMSSRSSLSMLRSPRVRPLITPAIATTATTATVVRAAQDQATPRKPQAAEAAGSQANTAWMQHAWAFIWLKICIGIIEASLQG